MVVHRLVLAFLCLVTACAHARPVLPNVPLIAGEVSIDASLEEAQWQSAASIELDQVSPPFEQQDVPATTQVRYFEDGSTLYIAFIAQDPDPSKIRAYLRDRDNSWGEDLVGVKLDTYADSRLAYQFFVNPLGVQTDAIENEMTGNESDSWNGIWQSEGKITEQGYVVEIAIPLSILNFAKQDGDKKWGIEFVRFLPRQDMLRLTHIEIDRDNACNLCQMADIKGFSVAQQGQNLAIVPTLVAASGRTRDPLVSRDWLYQQNYEIGADIRWAISPELTFSGTINPDFSQVEADVAQLSINNTFALFFDEKRPFFVENQDYFSTNLNLIYTRNINAPDYGIKLTGRHNKHSLGLFIANDESTTLVIPGNLGSRISQLEKPSNNIAARYRFDISGDLSVGASTTLREADDYHNYLLSADVKYRPSESDTFSAQIVRTDTQYPLTFFQQFCEADCADEQTLNEAAIRTREQDAFSGGAYLLTYQHETRDYSLNARHEYFDKGFRADLGSISRVDRKKSVLGGQYSLWSHDEHWWTRLRLRGDWDITHNMAGELLERELEADISLLANYQTYVQVKRMTRTRVGLRQDSSSLAIDNNAQQFDESHTTLYVETQPYEQWAFEGFVRRADTIDFANNRLAEQILFEPSIDLNLGTRTQVSLQHTYSSLDSGDQPLFTANLTDWRISYQFTQRQLMRLTLAYSDIERNTANYPYAVQEKQRDFGFQLLYSYKLNPLTKFFVGVSQSAFSNDNLQALTADSQSVFMKFSYAYLQ